MKLVTRGALIRLGIGGLLAAAWIGWYGPRMIIMPGKSHRGPLPELTAAERELSASLRADVATLCVEIGERNYMNYSGLRQSANFIAASFAALGYPVERHAVVVPEFALVAARASSGDGLEPEFVNVIAELRGVSFPDEIVVVGAHYDSVAVPGCVGADDNASAVAGMLAMARALAGREVARTVRFVAFVNEEPPFFQGAGMGSLAYAQRCRERNENIIGMLCLEMIGYYTDEPGSQHYPLPWLFHLFYPDRGDFITFVSNPRSRPLLHRAIGEFRQTTSFPSEGAAPPGWITGVSWSDHWSFWRQGYPAVMITDTALFRNPWYHTAQDLPEHLDYERMARVTAGLIRVLEEMAAGN